MNLNISYASSFCEQYEGGSGDDEFRKADKKKTDGEKDYVNILERLANSFDIPYICIHEKYINPTLFVFEPQNLY